MSAFYILKPNTANSAVDFQLYIPSSWNDRNTTENIRATGGYARKIKITGLNIPTNSRVIHVDDPGCKWYKSKLTGTYNVYGDTYSDAIASLANNSNYKEVTYDEWASGNHLTIDSATDSECIASYTTDTNYSYVIVFPGNVSDWFIELAPTTKYQLTTVLTRCTCDVTPGEYAEGTEITATITPELGYELLTAPTITGSSGTWSKVGDNWTCTFQITEDTTITATATAIPVYYPVTYSLTHCTCDQSVASVLAGTELTFTFTPESGYELFTNPPTLETSGSTIFCTSQSDPASFVVSGTVVVDGPLTVTGSAITAPVTVPVTDNTTYLIVSPGDNALPYNAPVTFTVTAIEHYSIATAPTINGHAMEESSDRYTLTIYPRTNLLIEGTAVEDHYITVTYVLSGCTVSPDEDTKYYDGDTITLTLVAGQGLYFQTVPYVTVMDIFHSQYKRDCTPLDPGEYPTRYQFVWDLASEPLRSATVHAVCQAIPLIEDFGVFNIYAPTLENLTAVSNMRYDFSESHEYYYKDVDLGQYVLSLMKVYVPFNTAVNAEIVLGGYQTGVSCPSITYPYASVDCKSVQIEEYNHDVTDYSSTTLRAFLPFYGFVNLDPVYYMGKEVSLDYEVELLTGKALITLNAEGTIIETFTCKVAMDIPYLLTLDKSVIGKHEYNEYLLMDKVPYIEQWVNLEDSTAKIRGNRDSYGKIGDFTGFQRIDIILENLPISKDEKDEIVSLCRNGVII